MEAEVTSLRGAKRRRNVNNFVVVAFRSNPGIASPFSSFRVRNDVVLYLFIGLLVYSFIGLFSPSKSYAATLWSYQCIDTMKISRDKARLWKDNPDLQQHIYWEMSVIKDMGANCVAIDTPYDEEFIPYLTKWVKAARVKNLHVWFRGNFSGWEQWFDYPKLSSTSQFLQNVQTFITGHPDLFADGDIFTAAPEAEDGGPFNQVEPEAYTGYRQFLISENKTEQKAFQIINKHATTNWLSMNGGLAKRMMDQETANGIGNLVTIDHYINGPEKMTEFVRYFHDTFHTNVAIGEFGAPIPDINGSLTEHAQAKFVDTVFRELYKNRDIIAGVNYWDLYDGSTALYNPDQSPREVVQVIKKYFSPVIIRGKVMNELSEPLSNISIRTTDGVANAITDKNGMYQLLVPGKPPEIFAGNNEYSFVGKKIPYSDNKNYRVNFALKLLYPDWKFRLKTQFYGIITFLQKKWTVNTHQLPH